MRVGVTRAWRRHCGVGRRSLARLAITTRTVATVTSVATITAVTTIKAIAARTLFFDIALGTVEQGLERQIGRAHV